MATEEPDYIVRAPLYPLQSHLKHCLRLWDGESVSAVRELIKAIRDQTGTPQNPVDWSDPDTWIAERLSGESSRLAAKIWNESGKEVNPRHVYGCYLFINRLSLLERVVGAYRLEARGQQFLADDPELIIELDAGEGIPKILSLLSETPFAKRSDLISD